MNIRLRSIFGWEAVYKIQEDRITRETSVEVRPCFRAGNTGQWKPDVNQGLNPYLVLHT